MNKLFTQLSCFQMLLFWFGLWFASSVILSSGIKAWFSNWCGYSQGNGSTMCANGRIRSKIGGILDQNIRGGVLLVSWIGATGPTRIHAEIGKISSMESTLAAIQVGMESLLRLPLSPLPKSPDAPKSKLTTPFHRRSCIASQNQYSNHRATLIRSL